MHITLVSMYYYPRVGGGAEQSLQYHAESLVRRGVRVSVLSLHSGTEPERFVHNGVECHTLPVPNLASCMNPKRRAPVAARALWHLFDVYNPAAARLLARELRQLKPDLVHSENLPGWSCAAWTTFRRLGLPHVQMLQDYQFSCPNAMRYRESENCGATCLPCLPFAALPRRLSQKVSHVVANSKYVRDVFRSLGFFRNARTFEVMYGPVPTPPRKALPPRTDSRLRIGYLGRLHFSKGLRVLIDAFINVRRPDAVLRIAGSGTEVYEAELRAAAQGHAVEFVGHVSAGEFLGTIDVLVVPSLWNEPMGRVVIEAQAHGVPVIAAARGGIPELLDEGRTGWLFDPAVPGELETRLQSLDVAVLGGMRESCRRWGENFAPEPLAERWLAIYSNMMATHKFGSRQTGEVEPCPAHLAAN